MTCREFRWNNTAVCTLQMWADAQLIPLLDLPIKG